MKQELRHPLVVIGGGTMGRAIVEGAVCAGVLAAERTLVVAPDPAKHEPFTKLGVACVTSVAEAFDGLYALEARCSSNAEGGSKGVNGQGMILLAIKPQVLGAVAREMEEAGGGVALVGSRLVMSILAGTPTARLAEMIGGRVVRLMPNTPARIGLGVTAICPGPGVTEAELAVARRLFKAVGRVIDLPEEMFDAFTAVAGSGPAYLFHLAEGMIAGAEAVGFARAQALDLVRATLIGAVGLLEAEAAPAELRAMVTSKGGTTAAAVGVLDARGVREAMCQAILAARDRGRELADENR